MPTLRVMVYIRDPGGVWVLPTHLVDSLRRAFPDVTFDQPDGRDEADARLGETDVVFGYAVRAENFALAKRLRWIQITAAGVGPALFPAMRESDVVLTNGKGLFSHDMAEHTLGVMLAFSRKLHLARDAQHERRWEQAGLMETPPPFGALRGGTLGVVGFGSIGREVARRATAFGMHVIAIRRRPGADAEPASEQWGPERLGELLERAHWVVLAPPLTDETRGLIGAPELARMRKDAVLVNLGRGGLIDEPALIEALQSGSIAGAALDVFEHEPLEAGHPFWSMPQVIVTPHVSGIGPRLWERAVELFASNLKAFKEGRPLQNVVDKQAGY